VNYLNWILRLVVGGAFVFAGALKIADPAAFAIAVSNYRIVPHELINLVAILMPWIEVVAGSFVLAGIWPRAAALVITSLTVMFAVIIGSALARGLNIECGCFGTMGGKHIGLVNLAIDTTLFCLAALLAWRGGDCPRQAKIQEGRGAELCSTT
jgi:putative oxidoreductase